MRLQVLNACGHDRFQVSLVGIKAKFVVLVHDIDDDETMNAIILRCQLNGISAATINEVKRCLDTTASCRWGNRELGIAKAEFEITPGEAGEFSVTFSVQRGPSCEPVTITLKSISYPGHTGFINGRHKSMH
jgi:hypothetical protein